MDIASENNTEIALASDMGPSLDAPRPQSAVDYRGRSLPGSGQKVSSAGDSQHLPTQREPSRIGTAIPCIHHHPFIYLSIYLSIYR